MSAQVLLPMLVQQVTRCGDLHRIGSTMPAAEALIALSDAFARFVVLLGQAPSLPPWQACLEELPLLIEALSAAQQRGDSVAVADILEHEVLPLLQRCG